MIGENQRETWVADRIREHREADALAAVQRIQRTAEALALDLPAGTTRQRAQEIALLAGIACANMGSV